MLLYTDPYSLLIHSLTRDHYSPRQPVKKTNVYLSDMGTMQIAYIYIN